MKRDEYSLPNSPSIFDKLEGNRYFTKLDIASACWTVPPTQPTEGSSSWNTGSQHRNNTEEEF